MAQRPSGWLVALATASAVALLVACSDSSATTASPSSVGGSGTAGRVAQWDSPTSLTNAPIRIDSAGNIILQSSGAVFIKAGSRCFKFDSTGMQTNAAGCPGL